MKANVKNLKVGEILSETQFYKVKSISGRNVLLSTESGDDISVNPSYVDNHLNSAVQFFSEEKLSRTDLISVFMRNTGIALTANYNKKLKDEDLKEKIAELYPNKGGILMSKNDFEKKVSGVIKTLSLGEERTISGVHYGKYDDMGRIHFVDMNLDKDPAKTYDTRQRTVDPRTLNWLIVEGVKYSVK